MKKKAKKKKPNITVKLNISFQDAIKIAASTPIKKEPKRSDKNK